MMGAIGYGHDAVMLAAARGLMPDAVEWLDAWSDSHMILPSESAAEHGPYRTARTPYAREVMRWLSPQHPCQRVVVIGASQMLKTQVAINWICSIIDQAPANILALEPTTNLAKRFSNRVAKTLPLIEKLRDKVAAPRSRDARNTIDTKEFSGGALYIATAGSAANLAEIMARYVFFDEIDRADGDVDGEGAPDRLAENRTTTYGHRRKMYYSSSPTHPETSRIVRLHARGTQCVLLVPCPHCGYEHELQWEAMDWDDVQTKAWMVCPDCACIIEEHSKPDMLAAGRWEATSQGDGETESARISALYMPLGWVSWLALVKEFVEAEKELELGNAELMQVFQNTRLARAWSSATEVADVAHLHTRGEDYAEWVVPAGGLIVTAGVDVQHDRLALVVRAWGRGEESWLVHWGEIPGVTMIPGQGAWSDLEAILLKPIPHALGGQLHIASMSVDTSDGTATQDAAYSFCRKHAGRNVRAVKGGSERGNLRHEIFSPPKQSVDVNRQNKAWKYGLQPYIVGTHKAKDLLLEARLELKAGQPGAMHWYASVRPDYWDQITAETKAPHRTIRGLKVWVKKSGQANEALDCEVYALHAARALKINLWRPGQWDALERALRQSALLVPALPAGAVETHHDDEAGATAAEGKVGAQVATVPAPAAPSTSSPVLPAKQPATPQKTVARRRNWITGFR